MPEDQGQPAGFLWCLLISVCSSDISMSWRWEDCHTKLLASKTRVAPIATQTIPRLELLSALLLARLINHVEKALAPEITLSEPTCYTDSRVALYWIKGSNKEWKQFVEWRSANLCQRSTGDTVQVIRIQLICLREGFPVSLENQLCLVEGSRMVELYC